MKRKASEPFVIKDKRSFRTWRNKLGIEEPKCTKCDKKFVVGDTVQPKKNCSSSSHYCTKCWNELSL